MKDEQEITSVAVPERVASGSLLQVIAQAAVDPRCDLDKMERLLAMQQTIVAEERRTAFMAALSRLTAKLPEIGKLGTSHHGKYARLEDIDRAIRPLIAEEGFSMSFDTAPIEGGKSIRISCRLSHAEGHSETKQIDLPLDTSGSKNGAQSVISTVSYGRRALTKMFFNLIEAGEDTDANNPEAITEEQARDIETAIQELKIDRVKFLGFMGAASVQEILARDLKKANNAIDTKRRSVK